jgi:hypothetical protein
MLGPLTVASPPLIGTMLFLPLIGTMLSLPVADAPVDRSAAAIEACRWGVVIDVSSSSSGAQRTQGVPQA